MVDIHLILSPPPRDRVLVSDGIRLCFCSERGVSGVSHKGSCVKPAVCAERMQLLLCRIDKNKHIKELWTQKQQQSRPSHLLNNLTSESLNARKHLSI